MNSNIQLLVFDLDGTIINSEKSHYESYKQALEEEGISLSQELFSKELVKGGHYLDLLPRILKTQDNELMQRIYEKKQLIQKDKISSLIIHPFVIEILKMFKGKKHIALATNASKSSVELIFKEFNLAHYFEFVLTVDDITNRKPHPECYLKCMEHFKVLPAQTLIFEDSLPGIQSARDSGAWIMKIENWKID